MRFSKTRKGCRFCPPSTQQGSLSPLQQHLHSLHVSASLSLGLHQRGCTQCCHSRSLACQDVPPPGEVDCGWRGKPQGHGCSGRAKDTWLFRTSAHPCRRWDLLPQVFLLRILAGSKCSYKHVPDLKFEATKMAESWDSQDSSPEIGVLGWISAEKAQMWLPAMVHSCLEANWRL